LLFQWAILDETRSVTSDIALRLARYLGTTPEFWLNMQRDYALARARITVGDTIRTRLTAFLSPSR
jgi:plasmid maintenance system antidote protein VapI